MQKWEDALLELETKEETVQLNDMELERKHTAAVNLEEALRDADSLMCVACKSYLVKT